MGSVTPAPPKWGMGVKMVSIVCASFVHVCARRLFVCAPPLHTVIKNGLGRGWGDAAPPQFGDCGENGVNRLCFVCARLCTQIFRLCSPFSPSKNGRGWGDAAPPIWARGIKLVSIVCASFVLVCAHKFFVCALPLPQLKMGGAGETLWLGGKW